MLHAEHQAAAVPAVSECCALLGEHAAMIEDALEQTPRQYAGPVYLPTRQAIREAERATHLLMAAANALSQAPHFAAVVPVPGGYTRPVDLLATAMAAINRARLALDGHQDSKSTPRANHVGLIIVSEWVKAADNDLRAVLAPAVKLLEGVKA